MAENFERAPSSTYTHSAPGGDSRNEEAAPRRHNNTRSRRRRRCKNYLDG